jgi:hypothetical protein
MTPTRRSSMAPAEWVFFGLNDDRTEFDGGYVAWDGQRFTMSGPRGMRHGGALPLTVVDGDTSCNSKRLRQLCPGAVRAGVQRFEEE